MADSLEQLAYDESQRTLDTQLNTVDTLRTRAGTLLAAAALVTTFLGGQALEGNRAFEVFGFVAISCFVVVGALTIFVLRPIDFHLSLDAADLVRRYVDETPRQQELSVVLRDLALHHDNSVRQNEDAVSHMALAFNVAAGFLAAEVAAWLIQLA